MYTIIYVSGKISDGATLSEGEQKVLIENARKIALTLWRLPKVYVLCPHTNSPWNTEPNIKKAFSFSFSGMTKEESYNSIVGADISIMDRSDVVLMLKNWETSKGARKEHDYAVNNNIPVCYSLAELSAMLKRRLKRCSMCKKVRKKLQKRENNLYCNGCFESINTIIEEYNRISNKSYIRIHKYP